MLSRTEACRSVSSPVHTNIPVAPSAASAPAQPDVFEPAAPTAAEVACQRVGVERLLALPVDAWELDAVRKERPLQRFWDGMLLGGPWLWRHAERHASAGNRGTATALYAAAVLPATVGLATGCVSWIVGLIVEASTSATEPVSEEAVRARRLIRCVRNAPTNVDSGQLSVVNARALASAIDAIRAEQLVRVRGDQILIRGIKKLRADIRCHAANARAVAGAKAQLQAWLPVA